MKSRWSEVLVAVATAILTVAMVDLAFAGPVTETPLKRLSVQEMAAWGATHVLELDKDSFKGLTTSTNTTTIITNAIPAGTLVKFVAMKLDQAWDTGSTYTDSLLTYSGWAADTDGFFTSTEIAADGTEVFAAVTPIIQENGASGLAGTNWVTNITYRATWPWQYCSTATNILTTLKQNSHGSCISSNTSGKVRYFFSLIFP